MTAYTGTRAGVIAKANGTGKANGHISRFIGVSKILEVMIFVLW